MKVAFTLGTIATVALLIPTPAIAQLSVEGPYVGVLYQEALSNAQCLQSAHERGMESAWNPRTGTCFHIKFVGSPIRSKQEAGCTCPYQFQSNDERCGYYSRYVQQGGQGLACFSED